MGDLHKIIVAKGLEKLPQNPKKCPIGLHWLLVNRSKAAWYIRRFQWLEFQSVEIISTY